MCVSTNIPFWFTLNSFMSMYIENICGHRCLYFKFAHIKPWTVWLPTRYNRTRKEIIGMKTLWVQILIRQIRLDFETLPAVGHSNWMPIHQIGCIVCDRSWIQPFFVTKYNWSLEISICSQICFTKNPGLNRWPP